MSLKSPVLHMMCGKIAAGKSTLAATLNQAPDTVLISEDDWLSSLFADTIKTPRDYVQCAAKLRQVLAPHVAQLLSAGVSVVLDVPANRPEDRAWLVTLLDQTGADHQFHVLDTPNEVCLSRLHARNAQGDHPFSATEAQFQQYLAYYQPPLPDEGFNLVVHTVD